MAQLRVDLADFEGRHKYAHYSYKILVYDTLLIMYRIPKFLYICTYIILHREICVTNTFILCCIYLLTVIAAKLLNHAQTH